MTVVFELDQMLAVKVARLLRLSGMSRWTLYRRLKEHGIERVSPHGHFFWATSFEQRWPEMYALIVADEARKAHAHRE